MSEVQNASGPKANEPVPEQQPGVATEEPLAFGQDASDSSGEANEEKAGVNGVPQDSKKGAEDGVASDDGQLGQDGTQDDEVDEGGRRKRKRAPPNPWTESEHHMFLLGLQQFGKGDWRSISRYFVQTRTPVQIASHAQKYFLRVKNEKKRQTQAGAYGGPMYPEGPFAQVSLEAVSAQNAAAGMKGDFPQRSATVIPPNPWPMMQMQPYGHGYPLPMRQYGPPPGYGQPMMQPPMYGSFGMQPMYRPPGMMPPSYGMWGQEGGYVPPEQWSGAAPRPPGQGFEFLPPNANSTAPGYEQRQLENPSPPPGGEQYDLPPGAAPVPEPTGQVCAERPKL